MDPALTAWLEAKNLGRAFAHAFDEEGLPRDAPSSAVRVLTGHLPPDVLHSVILAASTDHVPLSSALVASYRGHPRIHFSDDQLRRGFGIFLPEITPAATAAAVAAAAKLAAGVASASSVLPSVAPVIEPQTFDDPRLANQALYPHFVERLNQDVLLPVWKRLRARRWAEWTLGGDGNPFVVKITKGNAKELGIPTYFQLIKTPMDLTRMLERLDSVGGKCYGSPEEFLADATLLISNAKAFNCPESARGPGGALPDVLPHPSTLTPEQRPAGSVYLMAWELEADIHAATPQLVKQWRTAELALRRQVLDDALRLAGQQLEAGAAAVTAVPGAATTEGSSSSAGAGAGSGGMDTT